MRIKIYTQIILIFLILFASIRSFTPKAYAYGDYDAVGKSIIVPNWQVYVDGIKIDNPEKAVTISTNNPSFFGYTLNDIIVYLKIESSPLTRISTTDSNGYWLYNLDKPLTPGIHKLYISISDNTGASSGAKLAATFRVPTTTEANAGTVVVPQALLNQINYLTVPLLLFSAVGILVIIYLFINFSTKRHKMDKHLL